MLKLYDCLGHSNLAKRNQTNLTKNGFGYDIVWNDHSVTNEFNVICIHVYLQSLKDQYVQKWCERCYSSSKLSFYINFKPNFDFQNYLDVINVGKFRRALATFRTSSHCLMTEKG